MRASARSSRPFFGLFFTGTGAGLLGLLASCLVSGALLGALFGLLRALPDAPGG